MYKEYYLQVRELADKIRSGDRESPTKPYASEHMPRKQSDEGGGFMSRPQASPTSEPEADDTQDMVLAYMNGLRGAEDTKDPIVTPYIKDGPVSSALNALGQIESTNNYNAVGPTVKKGMYAGDKAYGKYQVMGKNIPQWTKETLGVSMTPDEFLRNPKAQDAVAAARMEASYKKYGSWEDAASVWFSGKPLKAAGDASDGYNTVPEYIAKFRRAFKS